VLPPKSTWILPKLKTGLCIYDLSYFCAWAFHKILKIY
jgi:hypothetical protein